VAAARLVVSGDTGIAHLASAYRTPSVILFGPTSPERWGPPATNPATVIWRGVTGDPHGRRVNPALLAIGSDEVLKAAEARLRGLDLDRLCLQYPHNAGKEPPDAIASCLAT
jgi:ADP-heptose:LPS heptosyltransferase